MITGAILCEILNRKFAIRTKIFGRFNFQKRIWRWIVIFVGIIILSLIIYFIEWLAYHVGISQMMSDVITDILFGFGVTFSLMALDSKLDEELRK